MIISGWRDLYDFLRWMRSNKPAPEKYIVYAQELEDLRADLAALGRLSLGAAVIAAAVAAGYVLGARW